MPEYSILLAGLVLVKGHIHFGRVYYNTGTSLLGWFWQRGIRISKVYATQPVAYTLLLGWFWQRDICISEVYYTAGLLAGLVLAKVHLYCGGRTIIQEHRRLGFCFIPPCSICLMSDGGGSILPTSDVKMICLNARHVLSITRRSLRMCRDIARISPLHMTGDSWRECRQDDTMTRVSDVHFAQDILATLLL